MGVKNAKINSKQNNKLGLNKKVEVKDEKAKAKVEAETTDTETPAKK